MNKFIALAFFALCATVAHGQIIPAYNLPLYSDIISQNAGGSSSSSAAAASSASSSNSNGLIQSTKLNSLNAVPLVSTIGAPLSALPINAYGPYGQLAGPLVGPYGSVIPQGWVSPYGPVGPVAPLAPGVVQLL